MWTYNHYSKELYHFGVKGMKWGVRRYQNEDGSLTTAGEKRYDRDTRGLSNKKKKEYKSDPDRWIKEDMERSKKLADASSTMVRDIKSARATGRSRAEERHRAKNQLDLSGRSDKELRDEINRKFLEKQYNDLFNPAPVSKGREFLDRFFEDAGHSLALTSSTLGILLAIKELRG